MPRKEKSRPIDLTGVAFEIEPMKKLIQDLTPANPLSSLSPAELHTVVCELSLYLGNFRHESGSPASKYFEDIDDFGNDARRLAGRMTKLFFEGYWSQILIPSELDAYRELPKHLLSFSRLLREVSRSFGKSGHKEKTMRNGHLVCASFYVRFLLKAYHDEHLSALLDLMGAKISGDAIRQKRRQLERNYPLIYAEAARRVRSTMSLLPKSL